MQFNPSIEKDPSKWGKPTVRSRVIISCWLSVAGVVGCYSEKMDEEIGLASGSSAVRPLPAYPLAGERKGALKGDQYDDIRLLNPEYYAITEPPGREGIRGMVEWESMSAIMVSITSWVTSSSALREMYVEIAKKSSAVAEVWVMYPSPTERQVFESALDSAGVDLDVVRWLPQPVESIWTVDYGPFPLVDPSTATQAFGDLVYYHGRPYDDSVPSRLGMSLGATTYRAPLIFEGGNIQADGQGRCFTTQRGLQYSGVAQSVMEQLLSDYLGCAETVILKDVTDDATGHVDMFFKLVSPSRAVLGKYSGDLDSENGARMEDNAAILSSLPGIMDLYRLPMPGYGLTQGPLGGLAKSDVPFTYANSTLLNGLNLWPVYSNPEWSNSRDEAASVWAEALPMYQHVEILADDVAQSSGAIHCITRTIPNLAIEKWVPDGVCLQGACTPPEGFETVASTAVCSTDDTCVGPAWLCSCNDCSSNCPEPKPVKDACEGVTFAGCCDGDTLVWCEDGRLRQQTCITNTCGFSENLGFYSCGTEGKASSNPELPMTCGQDELCEPVCGARECGPDSCGGSCGKCRLGTCEAGICVERAQGTTDGDGDPPITPPSAIENKTSGCNNSAPPIGKHSLPFLVLLLCFCLLIRREY